MRLRIPLTHNGYDTGLFKWGLGTLFKICALLDACDQDPRLSLFHEIYDNLAAFPTDERGLMISKGTSVATSHRHYSHLLPCWNTGILSWDDDADRNLCIKSLDNWHAGSNNGACNAGAFQNPAKCNPEEDMTWEWDGFSYPASTSYNARALRPEAAMGNLTLMLNTVWPKRTLNWGCPHKGKSWPGMSDTRCVGAAMQPNTFQGENGGNSHADPTSETPLAMAGAVQDMLMFSDDATDSFRVFYGVPDWVEEASFHQLRAASDNPSPTTNPSIVLC